MEMDSRPEPPVMEYGQFPEPESSEMLLMMLFMMMAMADQEADPPPWSDYGYQEECYSYESCMYGTEPGYHEYEQFPEPESSEMLLMMLFMMMAMADQEAYPPPWSDYGYQEECYSYESCMYGTEPYYEYGDDDYAQEEYYEHEYEDDDSQYQTEDDFYGMPPLSGKEWDPEALALYEALLELLSQSFLSDDFG